MADVVYGVGREAESSVYQVMECLQIGFQAAIKLSVNPDPELQDYADRLKEILTPAFTNVLHAFNDTQQPFMPLYDSLQWLYHALELLTAANLKPTVVPPFNPHFLGIYPIITQPHRRLRQFLPGSETPGNQ
jgi:hypothetical protein